MEGKLEVNGVTYVTEKGRGHECSKCDMRSIAGGCYNICRFFGNDLHLVRKKSSLADYKSINSYEDACDALGEYPILSKDFVRSLGDNNGDMDFYIYGCEKKNIEWETLVYKLPEHIIALMKLETIGRSLWGFDFYPSPILYANRNLIQENEEKNNYLHSEKFEELWKQYSEVKE